MAYETTTFDPDMETREAEAMQTAMRRARKRGAEAMQDSVDFVRRHPAAAVAVSLAIGAAIGALIVNALREEEPETVAERLRQFRDTMGEAGAEAWDSVRDKAEDAVSRLRGALDSVLKKVA